MPSVCRVPSRVAGRYKSVSRGERGDGIVIVSRDRVGENVRRDHAGMPGGLAVNRGRDSENNNLR